jgi:hypothetical protein
MAKSSENIVHGLDVVPDDDFAMWTGHTAGFNQDEAKATMTDWQQETSSRYMFRDGPGQRHAILWLRLYEFPVLCFLVIERLRQATATKGKSEQVRKLQSFGV